MLEVNEFTMDPRSDGSCSWRLRLWGTYPKHSPEEVHELIDRMFLAMEQYKPPQKD